VAHRDARRVASDLSYLCGQLGFVRYRLIELEAMARGLMVKIRALAEGHGPR
jgi:hypothetical protein